MTISEKLSETIAQKERIASEVVLQSDKITEIKSGIYDILESDELPKSELIGFIDGTTTELTANDLQGMTKIRKYAFYYSPIKSIEIPNTVTNIDSYAFQYCNSLTKVNYLGTVDEWVGISFSDYANPIFYAKDLYINNELVTTANITTATKISNEAFSGCRSLTSVVIGNSVTNIGDYAFQNCYGLASAVIPNSVTNIGNAAFRFCESLTSVVVPDSVTNIGGNALVIGSSSNKATITMLSTTPPTISSNTFDTSRLQNIIVQKGYGDIYKSATNWSIFADYIVEASE